FFMCTATPVLYILSLHDALPIYWLSPSELPAGVSIEDWRKTVNNPDPDDEKEWLRRLSFFPTEIEGYKNNQTVNWVDEGFRTGLDRKSTRLNSSHVKISYAVFCL